jgi:hypothetical protein
MDLIGSRVLSVFHYLFKAAGTLIGNVKDKVCINIYYYTYSAYM